MRLLTPSLLLALLLTVSACSDGVDPGDSSNEDPIAHEGRIDPLDGSFVLREIRTDDGRPIRLQLIGRDLQVDPETATVSLEVALRNGSNIALHPNLYVWLRDFRPEGVMPINADLWPPADGLPGPSFYGYTYSELLGEDAVLSPGEDSEFKLWTFYDEGLTPFQFHAEVEFSLHPAGAVLAGTVFNDVDGDGVQGGDESGFTAGIVYVDAPNGNTKSLRVGAAGGYETQVTEPGLYTLRYLPPPTLTLVPLEFTTPNPLEVLLTPDSDGLPQDYRDANFGVRTMVPVPPVVITDKSPEEIPSDPYQLRELSLRELVLSADVGFSGCSQDHPFQLYMTGGGFMESNPVQANLVLSHDDRGELCDAFFERRTLFDLTPIVRLYREQYGDDTTAAGEDVVILNLRGPDGELHKLRFTF